MVAFISRELHKGWGLACRIHMVWVGAGLPAVLGEHASCSKKQAWPCVFYSLGYQEEQLKLGEGDLFNTQKAKMTFMMWVKKRRKRTRKHIQNWQRSASGSLSEEATLISGP